MRERAFSKGKGLEAGVFQEGQAGQGGRSGGARESRKEDSGELTGADRSSILGQGLTHRDSDRAGQSRRVGR